MKDMRDRRRWGGGLGHVEHVKDLGYCPKKSRKSLNTFGEEEGEMREDSEGGLMKCTKRWLRLVSGEWIIERQEGKQGAALGSSPGGPPKRR